MHRKLTVYPHSMCGDRPSNEDVELFKFNLANYDDYCNGIKDHEYDPRSGFVDFFLICDGHGGDSVAKYVGPLLKEKFTKNLRYPLANNYINNLYDTIQHKLINHPHNIANGCGCTALVVIRCLDPYRKKKDILQIINLGDCRAILSTNGLAIPLTKDHKPYWSDEKKRIDKVNDTSHKKRLIHYDHGDWRVGDLSVSRAFGDLDNTPHVTHKPDIFEYPLQDSEEFIIMACDGVWDVLENHDAVNLVRDFIKNNNIDLYEISGDNNVDIYESVYEKTKEIRNKYVEFNPEKEKQLATKNGILNVARVLAKYAYAKGSTDNISIYIIQLKSF